MLKNYNFELNNRLNPSSNRNTKTFCSTNDVNENHLIMNLNENNDIEGEYNGVFFVIQITNSYEPFMIAFRFKNKESKSIYLEKSGLFGYIGLKGSEKNNDNLYTYESIFK